MGSTVLITTLAVALVALSFLYQQSVFARYRLEAERAKRQETEERRVLLARIVAAKEHQGFLEAQLTRTHETYQGLLALEQQRNALRPATVSTIPAPETRAAQESQEAAMAAAVRAIQHAAEAEGFTLSVAEATAEARRVLARAGMMAGTVEP